MKSPQTTYHFEVYNNLHTNYGEGTLFCTINPPHYLRYNDELLGFVDTLREKMGVEYRVVMVKRTEQFTTIEYNPYTEA
jgi:hypothetical protein